MHRAHHRFAQAVIALSLLAAPSLAAAQACLGNPSFAKGHLQLGADVQVDKRSTAFGASFVGGSESVFGGVGVGGVTYDDLDGSTLVLGGTLGYQVPISAGGAQICPVLTASQGNGPSDFDGLGTDLRSRNFGFGISMGTTLARGARVSLVPAASVGFAFTQVDLSGPLISDTQTETFGTAGVALGILVSDALSIRPNVRFPFGLDNADPIFGVGITLNYGGRR